MIVASPDVPFPLPTPRSLFYTPIVALAERVGGSDPARMQVQVSVGDVLLRPAFARTHAAGETDRVDVGLILNFDLFRITVLDLWRRWEVRELYKMHS